MVRRPQLVALGTVLLLALVLLNLPDHLAGKCKLAIGSLFLPLFGLVGSVHHLAQEGQKAVIPRSLLTREIDTLRRENQALRLQLLQSQAAADENARLRQFAAWQQTSPWKSKLARIVTRDTANWWRSARIDLGSRDGLRAGLPVVTPEGLVGRVETVTFASADIVFVGDAKCRVAVVVRETGENGVLSTLALGMLDHRLVYLTHLPRHTNLRPGQTVFTSGLGGVFPAGIPVGTIVDTRSVGYGLYSEARVKLAANSSRLREVLVLLP